MKMSRSTVKVLKGATIEDVYSHEGSPGGHNNDQIKLMLDSGKVVRIDAYAMSGIEVQVS